MLLPLGCELLGVCSVLNGSIGFYSEWFGLCRTRGGANYDLAGVHLVGLMYATLAGSITSALGYVVWYWVRVRMAAITAGTVQLSVPVLSAVLGLLILDEALSVRGTVAAIIVLLGIALTTRATRVAQK